MDEINYNQLFGLEETGAEGQEAADPAEAKETEGEEVQTVAESDVEEAGGEEQEEPAAESTGESKGKTEEDRKAAARRRARERETEKEKARQDARKEAEAYLEESMKALGIVDPYTNKTISTREEMEAYRDRHAREQRSRAMRKAGMTEEEFNAMVEASPQMQQARAAQNEAEKTVQAARQQQFRQTVERELMEIRKLDPSVTSMDDVLRMDTAEAFRKNVGKGMSYLDAFKLANFDAIRNAASERGKRDAVVREKGKEHLGRTAGRGAGAVTVPADVLEEYRTFMPDATDAEIQNHWAKYSRK